MGRWAQAKRRGGGGSNQNPPLMVTGATLELVTPGVQATLVVTFNKPLAAASAGRGDWSVISGFDEDWNDAGAGGSVSGAQLTITMFSSGGNPGDPTGEFQMAGLPIVALDGSSYSSTASFAVTEI